MLSPPMLPQNHWYLIAPSRELRPGKPLGLKRFGADLVLWRDQAGVAWAQRDHCPHRSARLSAGKIVGDAVECPFHGFRFDAQGSCVAAPCEGANGHLRHLQNQSFALREEHGYLWMWWGEEAPSEDPLPWFDELHASMPYHEQSTVWETSYQRAVENQLDWAHLPFVHRNSIGIGFPHELDIQSELEGDQIYTLSLIHI